MTTPPIGLALALRKANRRRVVTINPSELTGPMGPMGPAGPSARVELPSVTIAETATIAINAGIRSINLSCPGLFKDEAVFITAVSAVPAGYMIGHCQAISDGTLNVRLLVPLIALGASYSITCKVFVLR